MFCLLSMVWFHDCVHLLKLIKLFNTLESWVAQMVKNLPALCETWIQSLVWEYRLKKGMATHTSILAWRIPKVRGAWRATVHGVATSWRWLSVSHTHKPRSCRVQTSIFQTVCPPFHSRQGFFFSYCFKFTLSSQCLRKHVAYAKIVQAEPKDHKSRVTLTRGWNSNSLTVAVTTIKV